MTYTITPLIAEDAICARVRELAASIDRAMAGKPYILLLLLNGALPFAAMLEKHLKSRPAVKAVKISSYAGMRNSGSVAWEGDCGDFQPDVPVGMDLDGHYRELPYIGKVVMADTVENSD